MKYKVTGKQNNSAMCFVCGMSNEFGMRAKFYECENHAGEQVLLCIVEPKPEYQSYPNRMHGGISAALVDEVVGRAISITQPKTWGVTTDLATRYRKPVPLDRTLYIEGKITIEKSRGFEGEGKLFHVGDDGKIVTCVTATARYLNAPIENIIGNGESMSNEEWFMVEEDLPEEIIIQ